LAIDNVSAYNYTKQPVLVSGRNPQIAANGFFGEANGGRGAPYDAVKQMQWRSQFASSISTDCPIVVPVIN
jgi:hypothetical protein